MLLLACGSPNFGPTPTISDLTIQSLLPSDTTRVAGSVHVVDPFGLTALAVNVTITGASGTQSLPPSP